MPVPDHIVRRRTGILLAYGTIALVYLFAVYYAAGLLDPIYGVDEEPSPQVTVHENRRMPQWAVMPESQVPSIVPPDNWPLDLSNSLGKYAIPEDLIAQWEQAMEKGKMGELLRPFIEQEDNWQEERDAFIKAREFLRATYANFEVHVDYRRRKYYFTDYVEQDLTRIHPVTPNGRRLMEARKFYLNDSAWARWRDNRDRGTKAPLPSMMFMLPDSIQRQDGKVWRAAYAYFFTENVNGQVVEPLRELLERWTDLKDSIVQRVKGGDDSVLNELPSSFY
jgi:hypothetical protein